MLYVHYHYSRENSQIPGAGRDCLAPPDRVLDRGQVPDRGAGQHGPDDLGAFLEGQLGQVAAGEARDPGDEDLHVRHPDPLG